MPTTYPVWRYICSQVTPGFFFFFLIFCTSFVKPTELVEFRMSGRAECQNTINLLRGAVPTALLLTADHQQPRHYTPYAAITQV